MGQLEVVYKVASPGPACMGLQLGSVRLGIMLERHRSYPGSLARVPLIASLTVPAILHVLATVGVVMVKYGQASVIPGIIKIFNGR